MSAFEALCAGSWQPVESIRISHRRMIICTVDDPYAFEESGPFTNVQIKSRQATLSDCTCFVRTGVYKCVLSPSEKSNGFGELQEPVSLPACLIVFSLGALSLEACSRCVLQ